jgi:very-short-patch-repair endonuclease
MPKRRHVTVEQVKRARTLRSRMSAAERIFWEMARGKQLGFEFRRQHPCFGITLDFYCHEAALCVEFDGEQHDPQRDARRDAYLRTKGIETIRVPNRDFFRLDRDEPWKDWIEAIVKKCEERAGRPAWPHPQPPPLEPRTDIDVRGEGAPERR